MQLEYRVESDINNGKRLEYSAFYQPSKPNMITTAPHIQESVEFIYIKHGDFSAFINQNEFELHEGDLLLILSRDIHSLRAKDGEKHGYYVMKVDPAVLYSPTDQAPYQYIIPFKLNKENKRCIWRKRELVNSQIYSVLKNITNSIDKKEYAHDLSKKINCMHLLLCVLQDWNTCGMCNDENNSDVSTLVYRSIEYINGNYMNDITALDCAHEIGLSYSYFSRQFCKVTGKSFREYLNSVRCNNAEKLLFTTDESISNIAYECGYSDLCYFISVFRKSRGISPNKYRKKYLQ